MDIRRLAKIGEKEAERLGRYHSAWQALKLEERTSEHSPMAR
jgi:hypothetical protein